jgi:probable phosphoglycerate mutase
MPGDSTGGTISTGRRIYFIRHGETAWSLSGRHTGSTDLPLTPHGEVMARRLATSLQQIPFSHVITSPRLRARTTCRLAGLAGTGRTATQIDADLTEWDYGDYEGLRTTEIRALQPGWDIWEHGCPHGELPAAAGRRADRLIARLLGMHGNIALFSHGQFGRTLAARWIGLPVREGQHFAVDPASIGILGFEADHPQRRVIALWNGKASDAAGTW